MQQTSGETCIYWPMEGTLTIGGDAVVEGGSGIEVRMGTVTIQDGATILGTGAYLDDTPVSGQSQADGSAILISTEMYGDGENQFDESPDITVNIAGGKLESSNGNAVTVYNLETTEKQEAKVNITDGELQAASGKAAVQVNMMEDCQTELTTTGTGENAIQTSGSSTTVTVSEDASQALVGQGSASSYYTDVNDALENVSASSENPATVYLLDNAEVTVTEGMTLVTPDAVSLTVRPEEGKVIEKVENQEDGTISYKVVEASDSTLQPPTVSLTADKTSAYVGDSITLTASAVSAEGATITYSWYKDGQKISGATASTLTVTSSGIYTVVVTAQKTVNNNVYSAEDDASISCTFVVRDDDDDNDNNNSGSSSSGSTSVRRYNIEADAGRGGDISPDGRVRVRRGENQTFRITADDGWEIADVEVDGESVGAVERYTFENVRTDHTISVTFRQIVTEPEEPQTPALPFTDVSEGDWYHDAVAYCWENGIMDGTSGTAFAPNMILTRAMMAQVLYNLAGGTPAAAAGFPDVSPTAWYADAVNWAAANGYVTGYDNGLFGPEDDLTREQMAAILYRYAGSPAPAGTLDGFADAASASAYAVDALRWAVGEGLLTGKDGGRLDPTGTASRAELAQILARFAG
ncbi:S-layer homology domain-containing protein [Flavonifractor sp. An10]|uniref:S-layer homology domain-containing protein n=1 Tax=Flavonifractor sp. An10 TaxID=1965537 RepID=UPI001FA8FF99|nr:S-layer homology domain-containing protein [Flavonifractor sp. An10]